MGCCFALVLSKCEAFFFPLQFLPPVLRPPAPAGDQRVHVVGEGKLQSIKRAVLDGILNYAMSRLRLVR